MPVTQEQVVHALRNVSDPETARDIVSVHPIKNIKIFDAIVSIEMVTASAAKDQLRAAITDAVQKIPGVEEVFIDFSAPAAQQAAAATGNPRAANPSQRPPHAPAQAPRDLRCGRM